MNILTTPNFLKPFSCIGILRPIYVLSGIWAITNYLQEIMSDSGIPLDPSLCTLILGIDRLVFACITPFFIQKLDPRISFATGALIKAISLYVMGGYFHLKLKYPDIMVNYSWIPLVCLFFKYMVQTALVMPVVFALLGELFPTEIRAFAVGIGQFSH